MFDRRRALTEVFADTQRLYTENQRLREAVEYSKAHTKLYAASDELAFPEKRMQPGVIEVTKHKAFEAAMLHHKAFPEDTITVLNFASAVNPGGGVKRGSSAQEESLCRCSTLYPTLDQRFLWDAYYNVNRAAKNVLHTDDCIWSPDVVICKTDESIPRRMAPEDWVMVNVISCAAPNLRHDPYNQYNPEGGTPVELSSEDLLKLHAARASHILKVAAVNHTDVLILGAFGCGAFENDPKVVASTYRMMFPEMQSHFKRVEFAVHCRGHETQNYDAFLDAFDDNSHTKDVLASASKLMDSYDEAFKELTK